MGRELRLPPELENFIARPGPITMVIRGPPGSGKTTLSLAMLEAFYGRKMFITGRRAKRGVLEDFPWLGSVEGHEIEVVDAVSASDGDPEPNPSMEAGEPANSEDLHTNVLQSLPPAFRRAWGRRSSGAADLERQLALLPPGMRRALAHAASDQRVMIVVDSWDAFVEECLDLLPSNPNVRLNREEIERLALRLIARGTAHLVLVLERPEASQLDYLVDGILTTSHEIQETHPERWIEMPKLRGVRIENESYPYTLEGGKFMCISPERREFAHPEVFVEPDPEPAEEAIWPGSKAFVEAFDRLRIGALTAIETDDHVTDAAIELLLFPMIASVLAGGGRVLSIPAPAQRLGELWSSLQGLLQPAQAQAQLRIVAPGATLPDAHPLLPCLMNVPRPTSDGPGAPIHSQIPKGREFVITPAGPNGSRNLAVVATDGLRLISNYSGSPYLPEALPVMIRSYDVGARPHIVFVARSTDPLVSGLRMIASLQISLRNRNGRTFASGLKPLTPAYSLTPRSPNQERAYGLLRIV